MYKGTIHTRAHFENKTYITANKNAIEGYLTFISNLKYVLKHIGISYETLCRIIDADGIHVNKDYPNRVFNGKCLSPSLTYCSFFTQKLNLPFHQLIMPTKEFRAFFDSLTTKSNEYTFNGPIVKFKGLKTGALRIEIIKGGYISVKGLNLDREVLITGGRITEIFENGRVLQLEAYPDGPYQQLKYKKYLKSFKYQKVIPTSHSSLSLTIPKKINFNTNL